MKTIFHRAGCLFSLFVAATLHAATLTWDGAGSSPGSPADGGGTWDTSTAQWSDGTSDAAWNNANGDTAVFGNANGAAGIVTLGADVTVGGLAFHAAGSGAYTIAGTSKITLGTAVTVEADADATISAALTGANNLTKTGSGTLTLSGTNDYTGVTRLSEGVLSIDSLGNGGAASGIGSASNTAANLVFDGGTLRYTGGAASSNRAFSLSTNGGAIDASGTGALALTASGSLGFSGNAGSRALTLTGTASGNSIALILRDPSASTATSLIKAGTGDWTLKGKNTYTGGTQITAGNLILGTSTTLASATGAVLIDGGTLSSAVAATTVGSDLTMSSGLLTSVGALTLAAGKNFSMNGGEVDFVLGASSDQILSLGAGTFAITGGTLALDVTGAGFAYGNTYSLFDGFASGSVSGLSITGYDTAHYAATLGSDGVLSFNAVPEPSTVALAALGLAGGLAAWRRREAGRKSA